MKPKTVYQHEEIGGSVAFVFVVAPPRLRRNGRRVFLINNIGTHALCWIHAERLVHKLDAYTEADRVAKARVRGLICWFYRDLIAYQNDPTPRRKAELKVRFDRIFNRRTGFVMLDRLLKRLLANKPELLVVRDRPDVPPTPTARSATSGAM